MNDLIKFERKFPNIAGTFAGVSFANGFGVSFISFKEGNKGVMSVGRAPVEQGGRHDLSELRSIISPELDGA